MTHLSPGGQNAARNRVRRISATALSGFIGKGVGAVATYAMVPMLLHAMGAELFGVWSTFYSLLTMTAFADFGIGNGMLNAIATANARDDHEELRKTVSSGVFLLTGLAGVFAAVLYILFPRLGPMVLDSELPAATAKLATGGLAVFATYAILSMPLSTGDRIATALQEGFALHFIRACILILTLGVVHATILGRGDFVALCVASVAPGLLGYCLTWWFVMWNRPWLQPSTTAFSWGRAHRLLRSGLGFFLIQVIGAVGFNMDTLLIAKGLGAVAATDFALASRYFSVAIVIGNILLAPLWPAYADAASRGELSWAKRTLMLSLGFAAAFGLAITGVLYAAGDWLIPLWLGKGFSLSGQLMAAMAGWTALSLVGSAIAMFWNGMHWLRLQCVMAVIFTGVSLPLKFWICRNGTLDQFVILNIICFLALEVLPGLLCTFLILKRH